MSEKIEFKILVDVLESPEHLTAAEYNLWQEACRASENAYAPYSNFLVGAALLLDDGSIFKGNNQENAAYPSGLCAERTALFSMSANHPDRKVEMIAVAARPKSSVNFVAATPCGACRQVMSEYENKQEKPITVIMQADGQKLYRIHTVKDLLPFQFCKDNLEPR